MHCSRQHLVFQQLQGMNKDTSLLIILQLVLTMTSIGQSRLNLEFRMAIISSYSWGLYVAFSARDFLNYDHFKYHYYCHRQLFIFVQKSAQSRGSSPLTLSVEVHKAQPLHLISMSTNWRGIKPQPSLLGVLSRRYSYHLFIHHRNPCYTFCSGCLLSRMSAQCSKVFFALCFPAVD